MEICKGCKVFKGIACCGGIITDNERRLTDMKRLEKINEIQKLEKKKLAFEAMKHDTENFYTKEVEINFNSKGNNYNKQYNDEEWIQVNKPVFIAYVMKEIEELDKKIQELIGEL